MTTATTSTERADLLETLAKHRRFLRFTVRELTDEQAAQRTTASELCLGGLIKHVAITEEQWVDFVVRGPEAMALTEDSWTEHASGFRMLEGETLAGHARTSTRGGAADRRARPRAARPGRLAPAPRGAVVRAGRAVVGAPRAAAHHRRDRQHAGHADILRESLDGAEDDGLRAALRGHTAVFREPNQQYGSEVLTVDQVSAPLPPGSRDP